MESINNLASDEKLATDAFARVQSDLAALAPDQLSQVNLDIQVAAGTILGALPEINALRGRMVKELPAFDLVQFDKLEDYVLALTFAQGAYQTATLPPDDLDEISTEASKLRQRLLADAQALALHELVDPRKLEQLKGLTGYKNVAQDLQMLSQILQESWPKIQGKSPIVAEDLQAASRIGTRLTRIVGLREQAPALLAAATEQRMRAFTLTMQAYEEARLAVGYLQRRNLDAESIAPNLYTGKGRPRATSASTTTASQTPAEGAAATSTTPVGSGTAAMPAVSPAVIAAGAAQKSAPASKDPFLS